jgi:hypothetical protein
MRTRESIPNSPRRDRADPYQAALDGLGLTLF